jgi:hypothetical protein
MKKSLAEICDYVWVNEPDCRRWNRDQFDNWVNWHYREGFICLVLNVDESIAGLAMIRPVLEPIDALDALKFDYEGNCLHISQVVCTAKGAITALAFAVRERFGMREFVSWHRPPWNKLEVHKASRLLKHLLRLGAAHVSK